MSVAGAGVTVVVPTCGRPDRIRSCTEALVRHTEGARIVVVDNNPAPVVGVPDPVVVVHEPEPGAARARNRGVAAAVGDIVAFVDDDILVGAGWLAALLAPFAVPSVVATVGPIALDLEAPRPRWLTPHLEHWYSALDLGPTTRPLAPDEYGWGADLAVRRAALEAVGGFDERLGPGMPVPFGDDTELLDRLRADGRVVIYAADAGVRHRIGADRLTLGWLAGRARAAGRTEVATPDLDLARDPRRRPLRALRSLAGGLHRGLSAFWRSLRDPARRPGLAAEQLAIWSSRLGAAGAHWSAPCEAADRATPSTVGVGRRPC